MNQTTFGRPSDPTRPHLNEEKEIGRTSLPKSFNHYLYASKQAQTYI